MYKKVIDKLLSMSGVEKERVATNLAKHHPSIFLKMCEEEVKKEPLDNNIVSILNDILAGRRSAAVKGIRDYFGHGLKESLDIFKVYDGDKSILLSYEETATLNKLNRVAKVLKG